MLRILHGTSYDFIRWWRWAAGLTIGFIAIGMADLLHKKPNFSIEFTGGTLMQLQFVTPPDVGAIRTALDNAGIHGAEIQQFGTNRDFTVRAQDRAHVAAQAKGAETIATQIEAVLKKRFGDNQVAVRKTEGVGPRADRPWRIELGNTVLPGEPRIDASPSTPHRPPTPRRGNSLRSYRWPTPVS